MSKLKKPNNLYGCSGPRLCWWRARQVWTQIGVTTSTHRTLLGPQPAKCHIYVHKDFMTLHHATAAKKREEEEYIPFLLCSGYLFVIFLLCWRHSLSDVTANHLHDTVSHRQCPQFCIVSCELLCPLSRHLPMTKGPHLYCLQSPAPPCSIYTLSTLYLLSIYSLSTHKTFASHYSGSRGELIESWSKSDSCCPLYQPEVSRYTHF